MAAWSSADLDCDPAKDNQVQEVCISTNGDRTTLVQVSPSLRNDFAEILPIGYLLFLEVFKKPLHSSFPPRKYQHIIREIYLDHKLLDKLNYLS
jgi:hypothetical protein